MRLTNRVLGLAISASLFLTACGDGHGSSKNTLYYNNYTGADTEAFEFLKRVAEEAHHLQASSSAVGNSQLAGEIKQTYATVAEEIFNLSDSENVLSPELLTVEPASNIQGLSGVVNSQEIVVDQFRRVLHNTNPRIADYAQERLPQLEELLSQTKASQ